MDGRTGRTGARNDLIKLTTDNPTTLYTYKDLIDLRGYNQKAAQNVMHNAYVAGIINRHKEKCPTTGLLRYGKDIDPEDRDVYVRDKKISDGLKGKKKYKAKTKGVPTEKDVRSMFADIQNQLLKLEEVTVDIVRRGGELEKIKDKIEGLMS